MTSKEVTEAAEDKWHGKNTINLLPFPSPNVQLTFRVVAGFKDMQLVGIVCECENFNHRVQDNHNSETNQKFLWLGEGKTGTQTFILTCKGFQLI